MSGEDKDEDRDDNQERDGDATQSEDVPLSDLRRDIERRRDRAPGEESAEEPGAESGEGTGEELGEKSAGESGEGTGEERTEEPRATGPLSNLREGVERRRRERREARPDADEAFEAAATEPVIDGEQVWEDLLAGQTEASAGLAFGEEVEGEQADVRVIPDRVCHNCKYFGDPPGVHCEHDGTEIRRVVDMDHFEVVDCPVVKNRSDLAGQ